MTTNPAQDIKRRTITITLLSLFMLFLAVEQLAVGVWRLELLTFFLYTLPSFIYILCAIAATLRIYLHKNTRRWPYKTIFITSAIQLFAYLVLSILALTHNGLYFGGFIVIIFMLVLSRKSLRSQKK